MYKLVKKGEIFPKTSRDVMWLSFKEDGSFSEAFNKIEVGLSLLMSPFNIFYTWQTTPVTEIIEEKEDYIHFKTKNSDYELFKEESKWLME